MDACPSCLCCLRLGLLKDWVCLVAQSHWHLSPLSLQLWKSDDFGQTWIMIQEHVKSFSWYVLHLRVTPSSCLLSFLTSCLVCCPAQTKDLGTNVCSGPGPLLPSPSRDPVPWGSGTAAWQETATDTGTQGCSTFPPVLACPSHLLKGLLLLGTRFLLHCSVSAEITPPPFFVLSRGVEPYDKPNTVYIERHEPSGASTVIRSTDFFQSRENKEIILEDVEDFQLRDKYLFATKSAVSITRAIHHRG